jgi:tetraacyldisaccharide 4'-kinase
MNFGRWFGLLRKCLFPFSIVYALVTSLRNLFYDLGWRSRASFEVPVIAVGNLNIGGTGKTPHIEYLIRLLQDDYKVAVLSRGYRRKSKGFLKASSTSTVEALGDESFSYFTKFPDTIVAVDVDRNRGIRKLLDLHPEIQVVLLDDAYQHRRVKASYYTLLTSYGDLYTDDFVLPVGNLRELKKGASRAASIHITKCPDHLSLKEREDLQKKIAPLKQQTLYFSKIVHARSLHSGSKTLSVEALKDCSVLLVTGIANPSSLLNYLESEGISFAHLEFPDHHNFRTADLKRIKAAFSAVNGSKKVLLTTSKDAVRLRGQFPEMYTLEIQTAFLTQTEASRYRSAIHSHIERFKSA